MNLWRWAAGVLCASAAIVSYAGTSATGTIKLLGTTGGVNTYDISLTNTGTTGIGTFWFSWVPGEDFMPSQPSSFGSPTGWHEDAVTGGAPGDGYAIRWRGSLTAGSTLDGFTFKSTDNFATLSGDSPLYPGTPVGTSVVYQNGPFSGGSDTFVVAAVPEPASMTLLALAGLGVARRRRRGGQQ